MPNKNDTNQIGNLNINPIILPVNQFIKGNFEYVLRKLIDLFSNQ